MNYKGYYCNPQYFESDHMYHGFIDKMDDADEIVAPSIDDFIRIYHQTVDDHLGAWRHRKSKRSWLFWEIVAAIIVIAALTCPDKSKHLEVLSDRAGYAISKSASNEGGLVALLGLAGNSLAKVYLQSALIVDNYFLFSVGRLDDSEGRRVVSIGAFGHIFTSSGDDMYNRLQQVDNE